MAIEERKFLGTEAVERLIENTRTEIAEGDEQVLANAKKYAEDLGVNYDAAGVAATKVQELADGQVAKNAQDIGNLENLETTDKDDLVDAINEVRRSVSAGGTAAAISITTDTTSEGAAKSYSVFQGNVKVGTIDIPKDMVVQSGEVVTNPAGQAAGTYLKLTLANATNDTIYINVGTLIDIYKAAANATQIQLTVDSATREISAVVVAGSITATELAANAVVTAKIADGNVTKAKLSTEVQASLDKADVAETNAKNYSDGLNTTMDNRVKTVEAALADGGSVDTDIATAKSEAISTAATDATTKANQALADAKAYTNTAIGGVDLSGIARNASDIDALENKQITNIATTTYALSGNFLGDVNGDGIVDASDLAWITTYADGNVPGAGFDSEAADINGDGSVDEEDVALATAIVNNMTDDEIVERVVVTYADNTTETFINYIPKPPVYTEITVDEIDAMFAS